MHRWFRTAAALLLAAMVAAPTFAQTLTGSITGTVKDASGALPLLGGWQSSFMLEGRPEPPPGQSPSADITRVTPGYFRSMGLRVVEGRVFTDQDGAQATPVAVVDETFARTHYPGEGVLGKRLRFGGHDDRDSKWLEIVGVVGHVKNYGVDQVSRVEVYLPYYQDTVTGGLTLLGGRLTDYLGRRSLFLTGLVVFTGASLATGLAPSPMFMVASRVVQGLGAALLTPAALAIITATFVGPRRTTAFAVWGALGAGGAAVGVVLGGVLTSWFGWQWVFFINVPIGAAAAAATLLVIPQARGAGELFRNLDLSGALVLIAGLATLV